MENDKIFWLDFRDTKEIKVRFRRGTPGSICCHAEMFIHGYRKALTDLGFVYAGYIDKQGISHPKNCVMSGEEMYVQ